MRRRWVEPDIRDEVVDYVTDWNLETGLAAGRFIGWLGIHSGKYYDWKERYGMANEHNGRVPRDTWLEQWERDAIIAFNSEHPTDGYRRLCYMMLDAGVVAVSPSSVYRVLKSAGLMRSWNRKPSRKGKGFNQPLKAHEHWHVDMSYLNIHGIFTTFAASLTA